MAWIMENLSTIIISAVLLAVIAAVVVKMARDKKQGKSSCGCGCANCVMHGSCHSDK